MKTYLISNLVLIAVIFASACSSKNSAALKSDPQYQAEFQPQVGYLSSEMERLRSTQVDLLAPTEFKRAEKSYKETARAFESGRKDESLREEIQETEKLIRAADKTANPHRNSLQALLDARKNALGSDAGSTSQFKETDEDAQEMMTEINDGRATLDQEKISKLAMEFHGTEVRKVKDASIGEIKSAIDLAKREGAEKYAPQTLKDVEQDRKTLEATIANDPKNTEQIYRNANDLKFKTDRLLQMTRQAKRFEKMSPEAIALYIEKMLEPIATAAGEPKMNHKALDVQATEITKTVATLKSESAQATSEARRLSGDLSTAQSKVSQLAGLEGLQKLEDKVNDIRSSFNEEEAKVYREGDRLVISLKSIQFPSGKSEIKPENFALLKKVEDSIADFGADATVTVAGHTDSVGSPQLNRDLSQQRAEAVRQYLLSNSPIKQDRISAVGHGFDQPIASNKTPTGRAMNRRIDVIIQTPTFSNGGKN